jgi:hypothetical protein
MAPQLLPNPGEVVHIDFRAPDSSAKQLQTRPIKLLQWNIERGYELDKVKTVERDSNCLLHALQEFEGLESWMICCLFQV